MKSVTLRICVFVLKFFLALFDDKVWSNTFWGKEAIIKWSSWALLTPRVRIGFVKRECYWLFVKVDNSVMSVQENYSKISCSDFTFSYVLCCYCQLESCLLLLNVLSRSSTSCDIQHCRLNICSYIGWIDKNCTNTMFCQDCRPAANVLSMFSIFFNVFQCCQCFVKIVDQLRPILEKMVALCSCCTAAHMRVLPKMAVGSFSSNSF